MKKELRYFAVLLFIGIAGFIFLVSGRKSEVQYIDKESAASEITSKASSVTEPSDTATKEAVSAVPDKSAERKILCVYVCGMVKNEGVYELYEGARVISAVKAAGGMLPKADSKAVNLAAPVTDGMKVYIPSIDEGSAVAENGDNIASSVSGSSGGLVNINTAGSEELQTIPGIGPSKAALIINYRNESGFFKTTEDIMLIKGIKEGLYNKIKDRITV